MSQIQTQKKKLSQALLVKKTDFQKIGRITSIHTKPVVNPIEGGWGACKLFGCLCYSFKGNKGYPCDQCGHSYKTHKNDD